MSGLFPPELIDAIASGESPASAYTAVLRHIRQDLVRARVGQDAAHALPRTLRRLLSEGAHAIRWDLGRLRTVEV